MKRALFTIRYSCLPAGMAFSYFILHISCFLLLTITVLFSQQFPNYFAYTKTPPGYAYSGQASWFDPWDINVYVSAIKYGQIHRSILMKNLYTTESQKPTLFYPLYPLIGAVAPTVNPFVLFHVTAMICSILLLIALYLCIRFILPSTLYSMLAVFLVSLGGGIGWVLPNLQSSADLAITGFTFQTALQRPHEAIGLMLAIVSLIAWLHAHTQNKFPVIPLITLCMSILFYPFEIVRFILITSTFVVMCNKHILHHIVHLGITALVVLTLALVYRGYLSHTAFNTVAALSLPPITLAQFLFGYGILLPLIGIRSYTYKQLDTVDRFLLLWITISIILSFVPVGFSRFFTRGLFFPMIVFIVKNRNEIARSMHIPITLYSTLLLIVLPLTTTRIFYRRIVETTRNNPWYYIPAPVSDIFNAIQQTPDDGILVADYTIANQLPAFTGKSVYYGHRIQTPDAETKMRETTALIDRRMKPEEFSRFIQSSNINALILPTDSSYEQAFALVNILATPQYSLYTK